MVRFILFSLFFSSFPCFSQTSPFEIVLESMEIDQVGGLQSYSFAQHEGKWLIIGGRLDGLHQRQPFAAFDQKGQNNQLFVIDPVTNQVWKSSIQSLEDKLQEQLKSTNMQFYQVGSTLCLTGGYGYSGLNKNHITFPYITIVDVKGVMAAIVSGTKIAPFFKQIHDEQFQVTGGRLEKIDSTFYLIGGHKFIGRYNPMGPKNGPGFIQEYTNSIRRFEILGDFNKPAVNHFSAWEDSLLLHRRDLNACPQILPSGEGIITIFSGVFQYEADLPWSNSINVNRNHLWVNPSFLQFYNHYHCGIIPIYSELSKEMHTLFFGGIAQYYHENGTLVQDNQVPFVKTISRVTRDSYGQMSEFKLPVEMPTLLGAGSEFIPNLNLPRYMNGVFRLDELPKDTTLMGYIYGGISSMQRNILFKDENNLSKASSTLFKVYLIKSTLGTDKINVQSNSMLNLEVFPDPFKGVFDLKFKLDKTTNVQIKLKTSDGKIVRNRLLKNQVSGINSYSIKSRKLRYFGDFILTVETENETVTRKIVVDY